MTWHRNTLGLWCACFQTYQPDNCNGCPAYPCPEFPLPRLDGIDAHDQQEANS